MHLNRFCLLFLTAVSVFFLLSCAARVESLYHHQTFTYKSMSSSIIAIGGVVSSLVDLNEGEINKYSLSLRNQITKEREKIDVAELGVIANKMGAENYSKMMAGYRSAGIISKAWLSQISESAPGIRYIVFARIDDNEIQKKRSYQNHFDDPWPFYRHHLRPSSRFRSYGRITYSTYRAMTVSLKIYDLIRREKVWSGSITNYLANQNRYETRWSGFLTLGTYPEPPAVSDLLEVIFEDFVKNLPKQDKK